MPKKHTYEFVKDYIESVQGYKLLSKEYNGNKAKLEIKCKNDHIYLMNFNSFQQGCRCPICKGQKSRLEKSNSQEYVKSVIESEGYKLLNKYENNKQKLKLICPDGHIYFTRFDSFLSGKRCFECLGSKKYTYEEVKNYIENEGFTLLSKEYKKINEKLKLLCKKGHIF